MAPDVSPMLLFNQNWSKLHDDYTTAVPVTVTEEYTVKSKRELWKLILIGFLYSLIVLFALAGNLLVVTAVLRYRRLRSVTNYFVVSLAVADLTVAMLVMPTSIIFELQGVWTFGWVFCYFWISCDVTCCTASILHLCIISLDRYLAITEPLLYNNRMSGKRARLIIVGIWLCSLAIGFLPIFLGWYADKSKVTLYVDSEDCGLFVNKPYAIISSTTSFYAPLIVMIITYHKIFKIASGQAAEIRRMEQAARNTAVNSSASGNITKNRNLRRKSRRQRRDAKAIRTLGTLMGLFCFCWLPFFLMYVIMPFCDSCNLPHLMESLITWLGYVNSCINPCVYALLNKDFRNAFKRTLYCIFKPRGWRRKPSRLSFQDKTFQFQGDTNNAVRDPLNFNETLQQIPESQDFSSSSPTPS